MEDRCEHHANTREKCHAAEQRVTTGKDFSRRGLEFAQRAHAGEDHGGIGKGIDPIHVLEDMVAQHADAECDTDEDQRERRMAGEARKEFVAGQDRLGAVLVHTQLSRW